MFGLGAPSFPKTSWPAITWISSVLYPMIPLSGSSEGLHPERRTTTAQPTARSTQGIAAPQIAPSHHACVVAVSLVAARLHPWIPI